MSSKKRILILIIEVSKLRIVRIRTIQKNLDKKVLFMKKSTGGRETSLTSGKESLSRYRAPVLPFEYRLQTV